ncbi:MAG: tetratricopeptide repeat protein [Chloroflexi bacterium]|nr:tetratricopeptide repeat protein [Chloroflexota bacterium]
MVNRFETEYLGARATPGLVNRIPILNKIKQAIDDRPSSHVIYITGPGGLGKTFLLRDVLRRCRRGGEWFAPEARIIAAEDVVDLYHAHTHSMEGLTHTTWEVLGPMRADLVRYERQVARFEREKYELAGPHGMLAELYKLRGEVAVAFLDDLNRLTRNYRLVLALDTAEKLLYETDRVQGVLRLGEEGIAVLPWLLKEFLPKLENAVILIAGRPKPERLREDLRTALPDRLIEYELPGFEQKQDAINYFNAVVEVVRQQGKNEIAERIAAIPEDTREVIWRYIGGRPVLLSLMIDYLVVANELLPAVKVPVEEARRKSNYELKEIEKNIEAELARLFQNTGRPADEAIRALAWARKGMDAEMLACVADMSLKEAERTLTELRELSFVKVRPADNRVFLHDEMYEMLYRHVLAKLPKARREKVYEAILRYYEDKIEQARAAVAHSQRSEYGKPEWERGPVPKGPPRPPADTEALARAIAHLYSLMVEEVYYRLRHDPVDGFKAYYTYRQEAFWTNEESPDMQLRNEMLEYLAEREGVERFDGLTRSDVEIDAGLSWSDRNLRRGSYSRVLDIARGLREKCPDLVEEGGPLVKAQLAASEGRALAYLGQDLDHAEKLLLSSVDTLRAFETEDDFQAWRRNILLADTLNTLGYLYRTMGRYHRAIYEYQRALPLLRSLAEQEKAETMRMAIEAQHANTLSNLSWALTWVGELQEALNTCRDALEMRERLGPRAPVAFTMTTMGLIQIMNDHPDRACVSCERALGIFRDLQQPRGVGLARIALAEAFRRMSSSTPELYTPEEDVEHLRLAEEHAKEAVDIFTSQVLERPQLIQALIELGCTYRDWAWILYQYGDADSGRRTLAHHGEAALRRAIREGEAEPGLLHMVVDAQVNLAWLYYYMGEDDKAERELEAVIKRVPPEHYIVLGRGLPDRELPQTFLWVQLGKAQLLYGEIAMRKFQQSKAKERLEYLETAAGHYTLSLAYNELFAPDFPDMRRAMAHMYDDLKALNVKEEFPVVYRGVDKAAEEYNLPKPTRMHRFLAKSFGPLPS